MTRLAIPLLMIALNLNAQVKSMMPTLVQTNAQSRLTWDSPEDKSRVYIGTNMASLLYSATTTNKWFPYTPGKVYGISGVDANGIEGPMAYYPSNRVGAIMEQRSTNLVNWTDQRVVEQYTNKPATPQSFGRWVDKTIGWLPPK